MGVEHPDPKNACRDNGHDRGQEEERAPVLQPAHLGVEQHRQRQADRHRDRQADCHVERVQQRATNAGRHCFAAFGVGPAPVDGEHFGVVIEADIGGRIDDIVFGEAHDRGENHRSAAEHDEPDHPRQCEAEPRVPLATIETARRVAVFESNPDGGGDRGQQGDIAPDEQAPVYDGRVLRLAVELVERPLYAFGLVTQRRLGAHRVVPRGVLCVGLRVPEHLARRRDGAEVAVRHHVDVRLCRLFDPLGHLGNVDISLDLEFVKLAIGLLARDVEATLGAFALGVVLVHHHAALNGGEELDQRPGRVEFVFGACRWDAQREAGDPTDVRFTLVDAPLRHRRRGGAESHVALVADKVAHEPVAVDEAGDLSHEEGILRVGLE